MVFSPFHYRDEHLCEACTLLSMTTDDGVELEGVVYEPEYPHSTLLVFVGRSHDAVGLINRFAKLYPQVRIITFNYRSYGKSEGVPNEKNLLQDGLKIAQLIKKNYGDFYLLGFSIGSSVAAYVASKVDVKALFLVGAFDSIPSLAAKKFGINVAAMIRYKFQTKKFMQNVHAASYLFVSRDDETTYIENARALKESINNLVYYVEIDDLHHKGLLWDERVVEKIRGVIQ
ncbi:MULTISPECIES: alpha/beta hydrolase [Sulfurimonas]|uniref:alpha/beta hydrolase n=1 Tax=Sulfurimonas TaxID=202746 RepID=UPI001FE2FB6E|nr:alpha/beta hydrolase [Sulfurimonas indica]